LRYTLVAFSNNMMFDDRQGLPLKVALTLLLLIKHISCAPIMYTYIEGSQMEDEYSILETWTNAWRRAGWEIKVLTPVDVMKHPLYPTFKKHMYEKNIAKAHRHNYFRNLAMATTPVGGFYTDMFVYPLQKVKADDVDEMGNAKLAHGGEMTFHDGVGGSAISGSLTAWDYINLHLVDHIETHYYDSLQTVPLGVIHYERNHLLINVFGTHDREICDKASSKFVIRLHEIDLRVMNVRPMKLPLKQTMISKWFNFYNFVCWEKRVTTAQLGVPFSG